MGNGEKRGLPALWDGKWAVRSSQQHKLMEGPNLVMQSVCSTLSCAPQKKADPALSFSLPGVHI